MGFSARQKIKLLLAIALVLGMSGQGWTSVVPMNPALTVDVTTHHGHEGVSCMMGDACSCCDEMDACEATCAASCGHASILLMAAPAVPTAANFELHPSWKQHFSNVIQDVDVPPPQRLS